MDDLFAREQQVYDDAVRYASLFQNGGASAAEMYESLMKEYGRLLRQMRRATRISDTTTIRLNSANTDLRDKVHYDPLTGIRNRRFMEENLSLLTKSLSRSGDLLSVLMMDVDFFKKYNDTYGHSMGDECLRAVAASLKGALTRKDDFVARYGGEEFIAVLPATDRDGAGVIADKLLRAVRALNVPHEKNEAARCVTISIGVTTGRVVENRDGGAYVEQADKALYRSKQNGRNQYTFLAMAEGAQ